MVLPFVAPLGYVLARAGPEETKNLAGRNSPPDSDPFSDVEFQKNLQAWQDKSPAANFSHSSLAKILWIVQRRLPNSLTDLRLRAHFLDFCIVSFETSNYCFHL